MWFGGGTVTEYVKQNLLDMECLVHGCDSLANSDLVELRLDSFLPVALGYIEIPTRFQLYRSDGVNSNKLDITRAHPNSLKTTGLGRYREETYTNDPPLEQL